MPQAMKPQPTKPQPQWKIDQEKTRLHDGLRALIERPKDGVALHQVIEAAKNLDLLGALDA